VTAEAGDILMVAAQGASVDGIVAWIGAGGAPAADLELRVGDQRYPLRDQWTRFAARGGDVNAQRITISGLPPGHAYTLQLVAHGEVVASAEASTLPPALPSDPDRPFTVLFGSCFSVAQDPACLVGAAVARLPSFARPSVTILAGDQVYVDSPAMHFLLHTHTKDDLADELRSRYLTTWTQRSDIGGFQRLLTVANTLFSSDDHEFWNNAPSAAAYVRDTWSAAGREMWRTAATSAFKLFQAERAGSTFKVGRLAFFVSDMRLDRTADGASFMAREQLDSLRAWVEALDGPGVLVTGQPIFVARTGWKGRVSDRGLADYAQYDDLVRILTATRHDVAVLTGDVHFGRVAHCELPSGQRLFEVISSPLALVHPLAAGKWEPAPPSFPAWPVAGAIQAPVFTNSYQRLNEHFVTAGFTGAGGAVRLSVTAWPIRAGGASVGEPVVTTVLH